MSATRKNSLYGNSHKILTLAKAAHLYSLDILIVEYHHFGPATSNCYLVHVVSMMKSHCRVCSVSWFVLTLVTSQGLRQPKAFTVNTTTDE